MNETLRQRNADLSDSLEQVIAKSEERESALMKTIDALKQQDVLLRQKVALFRSLTLFILRFRLKRLWMLEKWNMRRLKSTYQKR